MKQIDCSSDLPRTSGQASIEVREPFLVEHVVPEPRNAKAFFSSVGD
jgi:hypothetical protein